MGLPSDTYIAVNVSPATVLAPGFDNTLADLPLAQLVLEITEHAPVEDYKSLRHALRRARQQGVRIAIDDVGAGFASFRHVLRLDPDIIKLDQEIVRGVESDPCRAKLVAGLIAGASAVSTLVIAEGIETEAQLLRLVELGAVAARVTSSVDRVVSNKPSWMPTRLLGSVLSATAGTAAGSTTP